MTYTNIIISISDAFRYQYLGDAGVVEPDDKAIAAEIILSQQDMPDYMRVPMYILTWLFDISGLVTNGRRFQSLDRAKRVARLEVWRQSRFGICRNFVRFYESLFLLIALQENVH